ncbi:MAG: sugar O-acetyltransferase, partial [Desertifilum sp. SIO1I2]|nr:sugar O-acetyltransferase [Desertifilum sp. SIO1I2]
MSELSKTEKQKMLAGELYFAADPELVGLRKNAARLTRLYNATTEEEGDLRSRLLQELFGTLGEKATIEPPFRCDYGLNIHSGDRLYLNYNCIVLDCCEVRIGNDVLLGPNVQLYTAYHPTDPQIRLMGLELAAP